MAEPASRRGLDWGVGSYERTARMLLPAAEVLVDAAAPRAGERVLDIGSGTGNAALLAAAAGARCLAVDPSERLLGVARAAAREQHLQLTVETGEVEALPAPDGSIDCLLPNFGVIFAADPDRAAAEMARVLAPADRALFTAWLPGGGVGALAATTQALVQAASGAPPPPPGFPWHDAAAVANLFSAHGLTVAEHGRHDLAFTAPSAEAFLDTEVTSHPMAVAAFDLLRRQGQAEPARERLLQVLTDHNEDPAGFRSTSRYVVLRAGRG